MYRMSALLLPDACNIKQAPVQGRITTVNDMTLHIAVHLERGPLRTKLVDRLHCVFSAVDQKTILSKECKGGIISVKRHHSGHHHPFFQRREISNKKVQKVQMKRFKWRVYQSKIAEREVCLAARWSRLTCSLKVERRRPAGST